MRISRPISSIEKRLLSEQKTKYLQAQDATSFHVEIKQSNGNVDK